MILASRESKHIRNTIAVVFTLAMVLIIGFGVVVFYLAESLSAQTLELSSAGPISPQAAPLLVGQADGIVRAAFLFLTLGTAFFVGLMFTLIYSLSPSLKRLAYAVKQVSQGNYFYRLNLPINNELGDIGRTLNVALDKVVDGQDALIAEKEAVERIVAQRTRQLKTEKTRFMLSIKSLPVGFMLVGTQKNVRLVNQVMADILGYKGTVKEDFQSNIDIKAELLNTLLARVDSVILDRHSFELDISTVTGQHYHVLYSPVQQTAKVTEGVVIVVEDVTEQVNLEHSKDEFLTITSHELRTPLVAIRGNGELLRMLYPDKMKEKQFSQIVDGIETSSARLSKIVNEILDAAYIEQDQFLIEPQEFDVIALVQEMADSQAVIAAEQQLSIKVQLAEGTTKLNVVADPKRVGQVLGGLIENSWKFTHTGGLTLGVTATKQRAKISVTDTGSGIPLDKRQMLFKKFGQLNSNVLIRETTPGTGLGLYIAKRTVEAMGGSLALESSTEGEGSTFSFTLPLA